MLALPSALSRATLLATLLLPLHTTFSVAQEADAPVTLTGTVVDAASGAPLAGAAVLVEGKRVVYSDAEGRFSVYRVPRGEGAIFVELLGYEPLVSPLDVQGAADLVLELSANPLMLEGIEVVGDRFRRRRNAVATSVRAFERKDLVSTASFSAEEFVRTRAGLVPAPCLVQTIGEDCAYVRGRPEPVTVYVDDARSVGGLAHLQMYRPQDLYLVEVFSGGRQIRAYTNWYFENVTRGKIFPMPILSF